jgi:hypothetical protein
MKFKPGWDVVSNSGARTKQLGAPCYLDVEDNSDGQYRMTITEAAHNPVAKGWTYLLKDSSGMNHEGWVAEAKFTAESPGK